MKDGDLAKALECLVLSRGANLSDSQKQQVREAAKRLRVMGSEIDRLKADNKALNEELTI